MLAALGLPADRSDAQALLHAAGGVAAAAADPDLRPGRLRRSRLHARRPLPPGPRERRAASRASWNSAGPARRGCPALHRPGYHRLTLDAGHATVAAAPPRCFTLDDAGAERHRGAAPWALAAQIYSLRTPRRRRHRRFRRRRGAGARRRPARRGGLAISPAHALFAADPGKYGPYAPSSRLALNVLHAAPGSGAGPAAPAAGRRGGGAAGRADRLAGGDRAQAGPAARAVRRRRRPPGLRRRSATTPGRALEDHARFEALHARMVARGPAALELARLAGRSCARPTRPARRGSSARTRGEVAFHAFCQWLADASLGAAQRAAREAGHADRPDRRPRRRHGRRRQPRLVAAGRDPARPLGRRAARHLLAARPGLGADRLLAAGDARGRLRRLPRAADAPTSATPAACASTTRWACSASGWCRRAPGRRRAPTCATPWTTCCGCSRSNRTATAPWSSARISAPCRRASTTGCERAGILGMRVLWFEQEKDGGFRPPAHWSRDAAAMTTTHDLPTVLGWWRGRDIDWRESLSLLPLGRERRGGAAPARARPRGAVVRLPGERRRRAAAGRQPPAPEDTDPVLDAALAHTGGAACRLAILPVEDVLGLPEQPNLPGTVDGHPELAPPPAGRGRHAAGRPARVAPARDRRPRPPARRRRLSHDRRHARSGGAAAAAARHRAPAIPRGLHPRRRRAAGALLQAARHHAISTPRPS